MAVMEFFVCESDVLYHDKDGVHQLREGAPVIPFILDRIKELYPNAYNALVERYSKSAANAPYFKYLIVRRFCKCNFGNLDLTAQDLDDTVFHFERVPCPLRGECPHEGVICMPVMETALSDAEMRVMRLVYDGCSNADIAEALCISQNTVKRHISTAYIKTRTKNRVEFVNYATNNSIFS